MFFHSSFYGSASLSNVSFMLNALCHGDILRLICLHIHALIQLCIDMVGKKISSTLSGCSVKLIILLKVGWVNKRYVEFITDGDELSTFGLDYHYS